MGHVLKTTRYWELDVYGLLGDCLHGEMETPGGLAWGKDGAGPGKRLVRSSCHQVKFGPTSFC